MASVLAMISEILSISGSSLNVMFDCVCECTDFKHNFKSEKETKKSIGVCYCRRGQRESYACMIKSRHLAISL